MTVAWRVDKGSLGIPIRLFYHPKDTARYKMEGGVLLRGSPSTDWVQHLQPAVSGGFTLYTSMCWVFIEQGGRRPSRRLTA